MTRAEFAQTDVSVAVAGSDKKNYEFRSSSSNVVFPGFMQILGGVQAVENSDENNTENASSELARLTGQENCNIIEATVSRSHIHSYNYRL